MANPNPYKARLARKQVRKHGDTRAVLRKLWKAVLWAEESIEEADTLELRLRAINCLAQIAVPYLKALEVGEFEARLAELEAQAAEKQSRR